MATTVAKPYICSVVPFVTRTCILEATFTVSPKRQYLGILFDMMTIEKRLIDAHAFSKIRLSSLIRLPGHLAAHNSRSCGSGVHLKMSGVRIGLGGWWLIGDVLFNAPPSLFADAVEDCGAGGHRELQPSGRGRGAQSEIHGDNQVNYTPERGAQLLNLGRVFVPISHWKAWGDHVGIVDCFNLQ